VTNEREARAARDEYLRILDRIHETRLDANVSVKLAAMRPTSTTARVA
jgi:hypothetical protein